MDPTTHQAPLSMGFPRQEYRSGLLFPSPGDLPNPGIKPVSLVYPALLVDFLPIVPSGKSSRTQRFKKKKKSNNTKCWWEGGGSETVTHRRWKSEMAQALRKTVLTVFIKLNIHLLCDPADPLCGIDSREMKVYLHTKTYTMLIAALFMNTKSQKWPKYSSVGEWINKPHIFINTILQQGRGELLIQESNNLPGPWSH